MLGAVIRYGKNTLVVELPTGTMDLQSKLSSIGIQNLPEDILLADEDSNPIRVKLYAGSPDEAHLLTLLTPERSLADANGSMIVLNHSAPEIQSHLRYGLIADRYSSLDGYLDEAKQLLQNKREPAKNEETKENPKLADALRLYERNPNIRLVVSAAYDGETEVFTLPLSERDCSSACVQLDERGADAVFKIEACRYGRPWDEIFDTVLQKEGLHALNAFAAAFPYMEDLQTYEAVIEYAGVTDSKSLICLADHIDEFEFYPGCNDCEDVAQEWISQTPYLQISGELEEYFDFDAYGSDLQDEYHGEFVSGGYVFLPDGRELDDILDTQEDMDLQ